jgi:hypothetical protein
MEAASLRPTRSRNTRLFGVLDGTFFTKKEEVDVVPSVPTIWPMEKYNPRPNALDGMLSAMGANFLEENIAQYKDSFKRFYQKCGVGSRPFCP